MELECNNVFRSTVLQMREFADSLVWKDLLQEITNWENRLLRELAEPTFDANSGQMVMAKNERAMYDEMLRGSLKALDNMRLLPTIVLGLIELQTQEQENVRTDAE